MHTNRNLAPTATSHVKIAFAGILLPYDASTYQSPAYSEGFTHPEYLLFDTFDLRSTNPMGIVTGIGAISDYLSDETSDVIMAGLLGQLGRIGIALPGHIIGVHFTQISCDGNRCTVTGFVVSDGDFRTGVRRNAITYR